MSAQAFVDPYQSPYENIGAYGGLKNSDSIGYRLGDFIGWFNSKNENAITTAKLNEAYERASVASARAWDEYMDSTHYQRMVKDLEAAGLNPWLALQSGLGGTSHTQTASQGGSSAKVKTEEKDSVAGIAGLLVSVAKLVATLMK